MAGTLALALLPGQALAATASEIIITGSRIPQANLTSTSPIQAVTDQEFLLQGKTEVADVINNLPQSITLPGIDFTNTPNPLSGPGGITTADLRGLGPQRTLVLIDGVRMAPADLSSGNPNPAADLDEIPGQLVERIEVVTGGASAVYGSDAVAGVINFIMKKDFEGIQIDGQFGWAMHQNDLDRAHVAIANSIAFGLLTANQFGFEKNVTDGQNADLAMSAGANSADGKGNVTAYFSYHRQNPVSNSTRDFGACLFATSTTTAGYDYCANSSNSNRFINANNGNNFGVKGTTGVGLGNRFVPWTGAGMVGAVPPRFFDAQPFQYISRDDTRYRFGALFHYDFNAGVSVYGSTMFMDDRSLTQVGPSAMFQQNGIQILNCDNPFLSAQQITALCDADQNPGLAGIQPIVDPDGIALNGNQGNASIIFGRRNVEGGPRQATYGHTSYRTKIGLRGAMGPNWSYDTFAQYYYASSTTGNDHDLNKARMTNALQVVDVGGVATCKSVVDGTDPLCVPWNIFSDGGVTQAALDYLSTSGFTQGYVEQIILGGAVTGDLTSDGVKTPWAEDGVGVAAGFEYRQDKGRFIPDATLQAGLLSGFGGALPATGGMYDVYEWFGEARVPFIQKKPWIEDLSVDGGYRFSHYGNNEAGNTHTYKFGLQYAPTQDGRFRVSFQRAVRAPNLTELFVPQYVTNSGILVSDPCAPKVSIVTGLVTPAAASAAACLLTGVTALQYGNGGTTNTVVQCPAAQCSVRQGGNPLLNPETSNTFSFGFIFTPTFFEGLTASVDFFKISQKHVVGVIGAPTVFTNCLNGVVPADCANVFRTPNGYLFGDTLAGGGYVITTLQNLAITRNTGVDAQASYSYDLPEGWGRLSAAASGTWTQHIYAQGAPGAPTTDCAGLFGSECGGVFPSWRHTLRISWDTPVGLLASLQWRHIGDMSLDENPGHGALSDGSLDTVNASLPEFDYFDLAGILDLGPGLSVRASVNNILDKNPPFVPGAGSGWNVNILDPAAVAGKAATGSPASGVGGPNSYPTYDLLGRVFSVGFTARF